MTYKYWYISLASSFRTVSCTFRTLAFTDLVPNKISMTSPSLMFREALAGLSFTSTRPASHASIGYGTPLDQS